MKEILSCQKCKELEGFIASTPPVYSFGDFDSKYWLLSINPSHNEFPEHVYDLHKYGLRSREEITGEIAEKILRNQHDYFKRDYYKKWFNPIERFLNEIGLSFGIDGRSANISNIDIVKCATNPVWSKILKHKENYITNCSHCLKRQIEDTTKLEYIIINGKTAFETLRATNLIENESESTLSNKPKLILYKGKIKDKKIKVIGSNRALDKAIIPLQRKMLIEEIRKMIKISTS